MKHFHCSCQPGVRNFFGSNLNEVLQVWTKNKRFKIMTTVKFSILQKLIFSRLQPFCVYCHRHNKQTSFSFPFSKLPFRRATLSLATYQSSFSRSRPIRARREFYRPIKSLVSSSILGGGVGSWRRGGTEAGGAGARLKAICGIRTQPALPILQPWRWLEEKQQGVEWVENSFYRELSSPTMDLIHFFR